jgi:hypothetical protein
MLFWTAWISLVVAAVNPYLSYVQSTKVLLIHKYILINDGSGSMVDENHVDGVGFRLKSVNEANKRFLRKLNKREDGTKDYVGALVFSNDAYVVSYLIDDPLFVEKKLEHINYRNHPLNQGTDMDKAIWAGINMAFMHKKRSDKLNSIKIKFYDRGRALHVDSKVEEVLAFKEEVVGSTLVIFTDGEFGADGSKDYMSIFKLLDFCRLAGIKVYIIVLDRVDPLVVAYSKATGGSAEIIREISSKTLGPIYERIVNTNANEYVYRETKMDQFLAQYFGLAALVLFSLYFMIKNTAARNFTEA